ASLRRLNGYFLPISSAARPARGGRNAEPRRPEVPPAKIKYRGEVVRPRVADREWAETPPPFDHPEDRRVVEDAMGDELPARERRDHQAGDAEAAQPVLGSDVRGHGRRDVIEEASPLVE